MKKNIIILGVLSLFVTVGFSQEKAFQIYNADGKKYLTEYLVSRAQKQM